MRIIAIMFVASALAGCGADLTSEIYVQDIRAWSSSGSQQQIPYTLTAYVPGAANNCNELWEQVKPAISRYLPEAKLAGCSARQGAIEDALNISAVLNVVPVKPRESRSAPGLLVLTVMSENVTANMGGTEREGINLQLHSSPADVEALRRDLRERNPLADFNFEELQLSITINNDEREPAELVVLAHNWGTGGREFKSPRSDQSNQ